MKTGILYFTIALVCVGTVAKAEHLTLADIFSNSCVSDLRFSGESFTNNLQAVFDGTAIIEYEDGVSKSYFTELQESKDHEIVRVLKTSHLGEHIEIICREKTDNGVKQFLLELVTVLRTHSPSRSMSRILKNFLQKNIPARFYQTEEYLDIMAKLHRSQN